MTSTAGNSEVVNLSLPAMLDQDTEKKPSETSTQLLKSQIMESTTPQSKLKMKELIVQNILASNSKNMND